VSWYRAEAEVTEEEVAQRIAGAPGVFWLCDEGKVFLGAFPVEKSAQVDPLGEDECEDPDAQLWPLWVGVLPYEHFRFWERRGGAQTDPREEPHLTEPVWQRYEAVAQLNGARLLVQGSNAVAVERLHSLLTTEKCRSSASVELRWAESPEAGEIHRTRVREALQLIASGELYQVNLARRFQFHVAGGPIELLRSLGKLAKAPFAAALDLGEVKVVSTSPELFLDCSPEGKVITRPIKGTRPRHSDTKMDAQLRRELEESEKERAELAMVIDIERNDLGRLAKTGSVKMLEGPHVVSYPTVHHREASVEAVIEKGVSRRDLICGMMPSGSITGAPKIAAMDVIHSLEAHRRGLYTGAIGFLTHGGAMRLSMAIRVLTMKNNMAHYFAGGGIVADSDPEQELQETRWKAEQLSALVRI